MLLHFRRLFPLLLLIFIDSFSYFVVIPILLQLYFNDTFGLLSPGTSQAARNMLTSFTICSSTFVALVVAPVIGSASDKYGRKKVLLVCLTTMGLGFLLPVIGILQKNIWLILLGRLVAGIGSASQPVAQAAVADICKGKEKALFLSWITIAMTLPIIVGPLAGGYLSDPSLVSWFNVTTPYLFAVAMIVLNFFLITFFFHETLLTYTIHKPTQKIREVVFGLSKVIKLYRLGLLLLIFFCIELSWSQYYQSIFLYLTQCFHYTNQKLSLYLAYLGLLMSIGLLFLYPLLIRFMSIEKCLRLSIVLSIIGISACALFPTALIQWIFAPLLAIFSGIAYVCLIELISNRASAAHQGLIMGYASTILWFAWLITGLNSGWLLSLYPTLPLYVATVAMLIGGWGVWRLSNLNLP